MIAFLIIAVVILAMIVIYIFINKKDNYKGKTMPEEIPVYSVEIIPETNKINELDHVLNNLSSYNYTTDNNINNKIITSMKTNADVMFNSDSFILGCAKLEPIGYKFSIPPSLGQFSSQDRTPLVFIPGLCASQLTCGWHFKDSPFLCTNNSDGELLWISPMMLLPEFLGGKCWKRRCMAYWGKNRFGIETYNNIDGMYSEPNYFGSMRSVDYLSDQVILDSVIVYFKNTSNVLRSYGYQDGVDLFAAPYEFRLILNEEVLSKWCKNLQTLIEAAYIKNGNKKVALMGHSCGCPLTHTFLLGMTQAWKDKHIAKFISIAGPYGGSSKAFRTMISGDNLGIPGKQEMFKDIGRTLACITWMLPKEDLFGNMNILKVGNKVYKPRDYTSIFNMIGKTPQYLQSVPYRNNMNKTNGCKNEIVLPYSQPTEAQYVYKNNIDEDPQIINENVYYMELQREGRWPSGVYTPEKAIGDGTVPFLSLYLPAMRWIDGSLTKQVNINADHLGVITNPDFLKYMVETLHRI